MSQVDCSTIDPGIRQVVKFLRDQCGLNTTDSGDGTSKPMGEDSCALPFPNVFAVVEDPDRLIKACRKVATLLWEQGVRVVPTPEHMGTIEPGTAIVECSFNVADGVAILQVLGLNDAGLALARAGKTGKVRA